MMRKNWVTTAGGIMAVLGGLPAAVSASHVAVPLWWNNFQFPLILIGLLGVGVLGIAAKGQDEPATPPPAIPAQKPASPPAQNS
jgi:hypothetical protein